MRLRCRDRAEEKPELDQLEGVLEPNKKGWRVVESRREEENSNGVVVVDGCE